MARSTAPLPTIAAMAALAALAGCHRVAGKVERLLEKTGLASSSTSPAITGTPGTLDVHARPAGPHPRVLLTQERLARLALMNGAPTSRSLFDQCRAARDKDIDSGYEAWDWANASLSLALCAKVTKDPGFSAAAVRYFKALLDDRYKVGDGAGGDGVVRHDDGYSIRTHGWIGAMAYDWLHDAPEMTPALRKKAMDRLVAWTAWFKESGFSHDQPISNYYAGYFGAVAFAGIAFEGDDPRADAFRQQTQRMWNQEIVPAYRTKLAGGDFPEGWQYGDMVGAILAIYADAEITSHPAAPGAPPPKPLVDDLPWLREAVTLRAFALQPDGKHTYDNGDWSNTPAVAPPHTLAALATVLPRSDPTSRTASFLARLARDDSKEDWKWLQLLADDPTRPAEDPRHPPASYLSRGTATVFARSSFAPGALWLSLTSEPTLSDHEHLDAGHFEIVRASDPLLIDGGGYGSPSSLSHNVVIVDDPLQSPDWETSSKHHDIITYKKNQGPFSDTANIARFDDGGGYAYALADYASAFNPAGWPGRKDRAVTRAEREVVFSRTPVAAAAVVAGDAGHGETGRVVVYDRLTLSDPRFTTTFVLHGGQAPQVTGPMARFATGGSAAWVTTLLPDGARSSLVDETHNKDSDDRPWFTNKPADGQTSVRYEVASPAAPASTERRFLHSIVIGARAGSTSASPVGAGRIAGDQVDGAVVDGEAYVFARGGPAAQAAPVAYRAPQTATRHIVCDLAPSAAYGVAVSADGDACRVTLSPGSQGGKAASKGGVLVIDLGAGCTLR